MHEVQVGRVVRALRRRRRWRQIDCADRAGVHRSTWSLLERGHPARLTLPTLRRCLAVLEVAMEVELRWRGAELDRLLDERHAGIQAAWQARLARWGWLVVAEASFNRYGERGRIDLLALHARTRALLAVEIKTEIADIQALLGALDVKSRVAPLVARELGWAHVASTTRALVIEDSTTNRRRVARFAPQFSRFELRGKAAISWLRMPAGNAGGLLVLTNLPYAQVRRARPLGTQRVRHVTQSRERGAPVTRGSVAVVPTRAGT